VMQATELVVVGDAAPDADIPTRILAPGERL